MGEHPGIIFVVWNGTISLFCTAINLFFLLCIFSQRRGTGEAKQPLKILLATVVICSAILQASFLKYIALTRSDVWLSLTVFHIVLKDLVEISMTTTVWLNVFYFSQIVPAQRALFIWLKSNIKLFIYCALAFDWMFLLSNGILEIFISFQKEQNTINSTINLQGNYTKPLKDSHYYVISLVSHAVELVYLFMSLVVMTGSGCATASYLRRHMENMKSNMKSSLKSQLRVTVTGMVQTLLYGLCATWIFTSMLTIDIFKTNFDENDYIFYSITSFYSLGTCINLCVGQSLFRQRAVEMWLKVSKVVKSMRHI